MTRKRTGRQGAAPFFFLFYGRKTQKISALLQNGRAAAGKERAFPALDEEILREKTNGFAGNLAKLKKFKEKAKGRFFCNKRKLQEIQEKFVQIFLGFLSLFD